MSCDIFQSRTADRNSRNVTLFLTTVVQWCLKNFLTDLTSNEDLKPCCLRREDRLRSLCKFDWKKKHFSNLINNFSLSCACFHYFFCCIEQFATVMEKSLNQNKGNSCYFLALDRLKEMFSVLHGRSWKLEVKSVNSLWIRGQKPVMQEVVLKIIFEAKQIKYHVPRAGLTVKIERYYSVSELSLISFL